MGDNANSGGSYQAALRPKLEVRFEEQAPSRATSIRKFIENVRSFEKSHKKPKPDRSHDTDYMITRLRKVFYGKSVYDDHLIPDVSSIGQKYGTEERTIEDEGFSVSTPDGVLPDTVKVVRKEYEVFNDDGEEPRVYEKDGVKLESGLYCDIGHVLTGLDAHNHETVVDPYRNPLINITSNVDAVTWVGDLGSVLAEAAFRRHKSDRSESGALSREKMNDLIAKYASPEDMLGNIDAYAIATEFATEEAAVRNMKLVNVTDAPPLSEILREYYLTNCPARLHRYTRFAKSIGLRWDGKRFVNKEMWKDKYIDEVNDAAAMYIMGSTGSKIAVAGLVGKLGLACGMASFGVVDVVLESFLKSLENKIREEN